MLASSNAGKLREFRAALPGIYLLSAAEAGVTDFPPENGSSYAENAALKAQHVAAISGLPALADDSGLEVEALGGAPGLFSARYGDKPSDEARMQHLLQELAATGSHRRARFVCTLAYATAASETHFFTGSCAGSITQELRGHHGHGYDPIFLSDDLQQTFGEASDAAKAKVSHRMRALAQFKDYLTQLKQREETQP